MFSKIMFPCLLRGEPRRPVLDRADQGGEAISPLDRRLLREVYAERGRSARSDINFRHFPVNI